MTKMLKLEHCLLSLTIGLSVISCTNDYEFMNDGLSQSWETSLIQIVSENSTLYSKSGIFLESYTEIDINDIDKSSFINSEARYPVMTGDKITLAPYEFISFDTLMCHVKSFHIDNLVKYALEHKSELIAVKLLWEVNDAPTNTIALFDKSTGELVYDNYLYNTITMGDKRLNNLRKHKLTRAESYYNGQDQGGETIYGSDSFSYYDVNGNRIATINLDWTEYGFWALQITYLENTNMYRFDYNYTHINTVFNWSESYNPCVPSGYNLQKGAIGLTPDDYNYRIKYYFYIGTNSYTLHLPSVSEGRIATNYGEGVVKTYKEKPYRSPDYVDRAFLEN